MPGGLGDALAQSIRAAFSCLAWCEWQIPKSLFDPDDWQKEALSSYDPGLLVLCGRQTGKSTTASVLGAWQGSTRPGQLVLLLAPTERQSKELFRKTQTILEARRHTAAIGNKPRSDIIRSTQSEMHLANKSIIKALPGSNPDAIRGPSPDLIIEDEAAFVGDRTFVALRPMLATKRAGRHVQLTTAYGRRGHFYERWSSGDPEWRRICVPSTECARISKKFLEGERRNLSDRAFRQEYLCEFLESSTSVFPADFIERLVDDNERHGDILPDDLPAEVLPRIDPGPWSEL